MIIKVNEQGGADSMITILQEQLENKERLFESESGKSFFFPCRLPFMLKTAGCSSFLFLT